MISELKRVETPITLWFWPPCQGQYLGPQPQIWAPPETARVTPSREFIKVLGCGERSQRQSRRRRGWGPGWGTLLPASLGGLG